MSVLPCAYRGQGCRTCSGVCGLVSRGQLTVSHRQTKAIQAGTQSTESAMQWPVGRGIEPETHAEQKNPLLDPFRFHVDRLWAVIIQQVVNNRTTMRPSSAHRATVKAFGVVAANNYVMYRTVTRTHVIGHGGSNTAMP